ncbi:MAG: GNAT family N-acetyltransferase [Chloroflexota bacterium]|nr:GNAT family N-acetyltransferase [Chloroflexota bacterium]
MATTGAGLRPMRPDEYPAMVAASKAGYAQDMTVNGGLPAEVARRKAETDFATILPDGLATPGHAIFVVEVDKQPVGRLWIAERTAHGGRSLFIYDIEIDEEHRGRGFGRAAMLLAEEEARARGLGRIELNVFGGNEVARRLYRSLGYRETAVQMAKDLG